MAYQNVGQCKFYIDYLNYSRAIGIGGTATTNIHWSDTDTLIGLNPTKIITSSPYSGTSLRDIDFTLYDAVENIFVTDKMWCGIFGHNFAEGDYWWAIGGGTDWAWATNLSPIVNTPTVFRTATDYNGWSLFNCTGLGGSSGVMRLSFYNPDSVNWNVKLGGFAIGKEYTMPH